MQYWLDQLRQLFILCKGMYRINSEYFYAHVAPCYSASKYEMHLVLVCVTGCFLPKTGQRLQDILQIPAKLAWRQISVCSELFWLRLLRDRRLDKSSVKWVTVFHSLYHLPFLPCYFCTTKQNSFKIHKLHPELGLDTNWKPMKLFQNMYHMFTIAFGW